MAWRRTNKYNRSPAEKRTYNGIVYDSQVEMKRAQQLDKLVARGEVSFWLRQVKFPLGPDFAARLDFLVFKPTINPYAPTVHVEEVKGADTPRWRDIQRLWKKYGPCPMLVFRKKGKDGWNISIIERDENENRRSGTIGVGCVAGSDFSHAEGSL